MKKRVKAIVIIFLSAIIIYSSVITVHYTVMFTRIAGTIQYKLQNTSSIKGVETTYHDFYEKYNSMKEEFSKDSNFVDLIPAVDFRASLDGVKDEFGNPNTYVTTYIFYQDLIDQEFVKITEGRCIDINHNGEDGIEIMVPSDFDVSVGDKITLTLSLYDENGKFIKRNSTVVGKYKKYIPFFFPKETFNSHFSKKIGYMNTGKYQPNIIVQNIVDYVDITSFTYQTDAYYNNDGDFAVKDSLDRNIRLLPVYKEGAKRDWNLLYDVAEKNNAIVFDDTHYEWLNCLVDMHGYLKMAIVSAVITVFGAVTFIIFIKYNFRRKNDNTVKEQPQGISQG